MSIIDVPVIAKEINEETKRIVATLPVTPSLVAVLVGDNSASNIYVKRKEEKCHEVGIHGHIVKMPSESTEKDILNTVAALNADKNVHGIIVQLPLPLHVNRFRVLNSVDPMKDVDGFHAENLGLLVQGEPRFVPCTPLAIKVVLDHLKIPLRSVCIINNSIVVGRPLAMLLDSDGATCTVCHIRTHDIKEVCKKADVLVVAVGRRPHFVVDSSFVKTGAVVIDVGISRVDGHVQGDVQTEEVNKIAAYVSPVPKGIGLLTVSMLLRNTIKACAELSKRDSIK